MQKVARISQIPHDRGLKINHLGDDILLVRDCGTVRAYGAACPHAGAPLDEGAVCNGRIICPWHKAQFAVGDGALLEPPALTPLTRYAAGLDGDAVLLGAEIPRQPPRAIGRADRPMLIVGAGAAGAAACSALRDYGYAGPVVMVGREASDPYDRTALSKFVIGGQMQPRDVAPLRPHEFYGEHSIERVIGEVTRLDAAQRRAVLADGREVVFAAAMICTGATPVALDIPGNNLDGVHSLRSLADAMAIVNGLREGAQAVILGSSFIGLEAACGLRGRGLGVSVASPDSVPFARQFGAEIGCALQTLHEAEGVRFHLGSRAVRLEGEGHVEAVLLDDGTWLEADIVLAAIGVKPEAAFVRGAGHDTDGGLHANEGMRIAEHVYAAGDVASFPLPRGGGRARIEHWRVAQQQARVAARNMLGEPSAYAGVPFFWTYHYGKRFEYLGHAAKWDQVVIEGELRRFDFVAFLCQSGLVRAVVACGRERETAVLIEAMRHDLPLAEARQLTGAMAALMD